MSVPYSRTFKFEINGLSLYHYEAGDSHGSGATTLMISGKCIKDMQTYAYAIIDAMGDAALLMNSLFAMEMHLKSVGIAPGTVMLAAQGIEFSLEVGDNSYMWSNTKINGEAVSAVEFKDKITEVMRPLVSRLAVYFRYIPVRRAELAKTA